MYHACMHTRPPARSASRAAAPPPKVALFALEDNQSSAEALELTVCASPLPVFRLSPDRGSVDGSAVHVTLTVFTRTPGPPPS